MENKILRYSVVRKLSVGHLTKNSIHALAMLKRSTENLCLSNLKRFSGSNKLKGQVKKSHPLLFVIIIILFVFLDLRVATSWSNDALKG